MVCDTVVYHPWVTHLIKFLDTTAGREKVLRFLQYLSRFIAFTSKSIKAQSLQLQFLLIRKVLRFLKPLNHIQLASKLFDNKLSSQDPVVRLASVAKNVFLAIYLGLDQINLLRLFKILPMGSNVRLNGIINLKVPRWANYFWLFSILSGIVSDVRGIQASDLELQQVALEESKVEDGKHDSIRETEILIKNIRQAKTGATRKLVWDLLDCIIVLNNLNHLKSRDDVVGLSGVITSLFGVQDVWKSIK